MLFPKQELVLQVSYRRAVTSILLEAAVRASLCHFEPMPPNIEHRLPIRVHHGKETSGIEGKEDDIGIIIEHVHRPEGEGPAKVHGEDNQPPSPTPPSNQIYASSSVS